MEIQESTEIVFAFHFRENKSARNKEKVPVCRIVSIWS